MRYTSLFVALFCFVLANKAQVTTLDSVIVSAERLELPIGSLTKAVSTLSAKEIEALPFNSVDELMRGMLGVNVNSRGPAGVQADFGIRGSTFSQVLVLLDGMPMNDPLTAHFNHGIPLPLAEIDRIIVLRGPASAAYGADAVGGVVHIISKSFAAKEDGFQFISDFNIGSYGAVSTDVGANYRDENWRFGIGFKSIQADGETQANPNFGPGLPGTDSLHNAFFDINMATMSLGYDVNDKLSFDARVAHDQRDFDAQYFYTASAFDESTEATSLSWIQTRGVYKAQKSKSTFNFALRNNTDRFEFNPLFSVNHHQTKRVVFGLDHEHTFSDATKIALGGLWSERYIESTDRGDHSDKNKAVYAILSHYFTPDLRAQVAGRMENDANFGTEILPQFGLTYSKGDLNVRAEYGKSIRGADYTERYISSQINPLSGGRNIGNPDLLSERATTISLGADYKLSETLQLSADVFQREGESLIDYFLTSSTLIDNADNLLDSTDYLYPQNVAAVTTSGLELALKHRLVKSGDWTVFSQGSLALLHTETPSGSEPSKYLSNHPEMDLSMSVTLSHTKMSASLTYEYLERKAEEIFAINGVIPSSYNLLHMNASYIMTPALTARLSIQNLSNTEYQEVLGSRMPGRWVMLGFRIRIND